MVSDVNVCSNRVLTEINEKRIQMVENAKEYGLTHEKTIQYSQELDVLIIEYQKQQKATKDEEVKFVIKDMILVLQKSFLRVKMI